MIQKTKKKGFTLLEMLIVIAIIAALVAIIIPIVSTETTKAAAAANAASLRAVEGQVSIHKLQYAGDFKEFVGRGQFLNNLSEGILGKIWDLIFGEGAAAESRAQYNILYPNADYEISVPGGAVIPNAVNAKALKAPRRDGGPDVVITADQIMQVCLTEDTVVAGYGDYTKDDFADIAEDGIYDGTTTSSGGGGSDSPVVEWIGEQICKYVDKKHTPGPNCICPYCGTTAHKDGDASSYYERSATRHGCTGCGNATVFHVDHVYEGSHNCKYSDDCTETTSECVDIDPNGLNVADHKCYMCGASPEAWHTDSDRDHDCDSRLCNYAMGGTCGGTKTYVDQTYHQICGYCEKKERHSWTGNDDEDNPQHTCSACNTTQDCDIQNNRCTVCGGSCVTPDTLVTLADGSQKRVDELTGNEMLLVWNHNTGSLDAAPVAYVIDHDKVVRETEIMKLVFSDGNYVKIIGEHVFFDATVGKYVAVTSANADSFIGHSFPAMSEGSNSLHMTKLAAVERTVEETEVYEVVTNNTLTCFTNNVLSGCAYMDGLLNIFDIDVETMAYDKSAMEADLAKYGTIDYAFFAPFVSREMFDMYNGQYMSVAMGKGVLSLGDIMDLIDMHYQYVG